MGVIFILAGDLDGQFKPIFDSYADVTSVKDLRASRFLFEMAGGLHLKLMVYRRGTDEELFKWYVGLYKWADNHDRDKLDQLVLLTEKRYPWKGEEIDTYFVLSHKKRVKLNHFMNKKLAARQEKTLFLKSPGEMAGMMMQPQDMYIWEGMELLCYRRKFAADSPVNGGVYVVQGWTETHVVVRLHEDYWRKKDPEPIVPEEDAELDSDDEDATSEPDDFCEGEEDDDETPAQKPPKGYKLVDVSEAAYTYTLTHAQAVRTLRLQHALVYANIQGRTMREKHLALLDTANMNFSVRHLIVATSRATHGKYVHVPSHVQEAAALQEAE